MAEEVVRADAGLPQISALAPQDALAAEGQIHGRVVDDGGRLAA